MGLMGWMYCDSPGQTQRKLHPGTNCLIQIKLARNRKNRDNMSPIRSRVQRRAIIVIDRDEDSLWTLKSTILNRWSPEHVFHDSGSPIHKTAFGPNIMQKHDYCSYT